MVKKLLLVLATCLAMGASASDLVLDIQLNGTWLEDGRKTGKLKQTGILVIQDIGSGTNVHSGIYYTLAKKGKGKNKPEITKTDDVEIYLISGKGKSFGMLVDIGGARMSGIGKAVIDSNHEYSQIIISSGHGAFMYSGFDDGVGTPATSALTETNRFLAELQIGKMQARLNKRLTTDARNSDGESAVDLWLGIKEQDK